MLKHSAILMAVAMLFANGCNKNEPASEEPNDTSSTEQSQSNMSSPHYAAELSCYVGEIGSRTNAHTIISDPSKERDPNLTISNQSISCGYPDKVSKISWRFIQHKENMDIYRFERTFPVDTNEQSTTSTSVTSKVSGTFCDLSYLKDKAKAGRWPETRSTKL